MPPKEKQPPPPPEPPVELDPAVVAAQYEERRHFETGESIARQRVGAMEAVSWRCVLAEREKRLDPKGWSERNTVKGPYFVYVKLMTGNRGIPQLNVKVIIEAKMTVNLFKQAIKAEAAKAMYHPAVETWFAPACQRLFAFGKEIDCSDEFNALLKDVGVQHGCSVLLSLNPNAPHAPMVPACV